MDFFIPKPFRIEALRKLMELFLRRTRPGLAVHSGPAIDPPDHVDVVDFERMTREFGGHPEVARKALRRFMAAGEDYYLKPLELALSAGDSARLHEAAHKLKGAAGCIRAGRLVRAADDVMRAVKAEDHVGIRSGLDALSGEMARCHRIIRGLLARDTAHSA